MKSESVKRLISSHLLRQKNVGGMLEICLLAFLKTQITPFSRVPRSDRFSDTGIKITKRDTSQNTHGATGA